MYLAREMQLVLICSLSATLLASLFFSLEVGKLHFFSCNDLYNDTAVPSVFLCAVAQPDKGSLQKDT